MAGDRGFRFTRPFHSIATDPRPIFGTPAGRATAASGFAAGTAALVIDVTGVVAVGVLAAVCISVYIQVP
jgi:hypothetical protein